MHTKKPKYKLNVSCYRFCAFCACDGSSCACDGSSWKSAWIFLFSCRRSGVYSNMN